MKVFKITTLLLASSLLVTSCSKEDLELINKNEPTADAITSEVSLYPVARSVYWAGFRNAGIDPLDNYGGFLNDVQRFHETMGDIVFVPWGNAGFRWVCSPKSYVLDDGSSVLRVGEVDQKTSLKLRNLSSQSTNPVVLEWMYMYRLNEQANLILTFAEKVKMSDSKKAAFKAWAYWWKGVAYSRIGSMYVAGLIKEGSVVSNKYLSHDKMIVEANATFDKAIAELGKVTNEAEYLEVIDGVMPSEFKDANPLSINSFKRNAYAYQARNLLVNTRDANTPTDVLTKVADLTSGTKALTASDFHFFVASSPDQSKTLLPQDWGTLISNSTESAYNTFPSPRWIQDFDPADKRFTNNIVEGDVVNNIRNRGICFGTKWYLNQGGAKNGAITYNKEMSGEFGIDKLYLAPTYEEVELMNAEVLLLQNDLSGAAAKIDEVKNYQGAGLPATTLLDKAAGLEEIRKERRRALAYRGVAFYYARRTGILDANTGRTGAWVFDASAKLNTNVKIIYDYMSYWDVPDNESSKNKPSADSDPIVTN